MTPHPALVGKRFDLLVITDVVSSTGRTFVSCLCDCGITSVKRLSNLIAGNTVSCGCKRRKGTHGHTKGTSRGGPRSPEYVAWRNMLHRCGNQSCDKYRYYGGRGITVCQRWKDSFEAFLTDMKLKPSPKHTLDRKDGSQNYTPENCHWVLQIEQIRNRSNSIILTFQGKTQLASEWAREIGLTKESFYSRLNRGWTGNELFNPKGQGRKKYGNTTSAPATEVGIASGPDNLSLDY